MIASLFKLLILAVRKLKIITLKPYWHVRTVILLKAFGVKYSSYSSMGVPVINVKNGTIKIGRLFKMNNAYSANIIGRQQPCILIVKNGNLTIGNNVGISSVAIVCHNSINIGNNVRIGGNTVIYDTDFHSLNLHDRIAIPEIKENIKTAPVIIEDNVFLGGHSTILKGVKIGKNSIIGAGSLVSKNIPTNEIWAGNPAIRIKKIINE